MATTNAITPIKRLNQAELWQRYRDYLYVDEATGLRVDISRMRFPETFFAEMNGRMTKAFQAMTALEQGAIANPDENRMVGHYWLRNSTLAPTPELRTAIDTTVAKIKSFAADVHKGTVKPPGAGRFQNVLVIGIGGSALGPQFVTGALTTPKDNLRAFFFDNTDPDGIDRTLDAIGGTAGGLGATLTVVISKSGGTKETRNGMLEAKQAYEKAGHDFSKHAVAVTQDGSELDKVAQSGKWLTTFPMWDWVGGRTSELSAVGLVPAALQGFDIDAMLTGAREVDALTRVADARKNPAALLSLMWFYVGGGKGQKDMVVLPYKDRLELFSRYLQQLVMESLGKERDRAGNVVHQGIAVYGNKGSTDQHAYVQQLREGVNNFFVTFIEVLGDRRGKSLFVEPGVTAGDYLEGFMLGTRTALYDNDRESITVTLGEVSPRSVGALIALYERAVGLYGELVDTNAYHQPGVEAGKKAAGQVIALQHKVLAHLKGHAGDKSGGTVEQIASHIGAADDVETIYHVLEHLAHNPDHGVVKSAGASPAAARYHLG